MKFSSDHSFISVFEELTEHALGNLIGGFTSSYGYNITSANTGSGETNNCNASNCTTDCGVGQNRNCNVTAHCGTIS